MVLEQWEGDGRAEVAAGSDRPVESYRDELDEFLASDLHAQPSGRKVSADEWELRRGLGVA